MYSSQQHVRRSHPIQQPPQQTVDGRLPTNPQPIPHSTGISPHTRFQTQAGGARNYPNFSPSQSPHQSGQYFASPGNANVATAPAPVKTPGNGTPQHYYYSGQMNQYSQSQMAPSYNPPVSKFSQQSSQNPQFPQNVPQNTPPPPPPPMMNYVPYPRMTNRFVSPTPPSSVMTPGHTQLATSPTTYFAPQSVPLYQGSMTPVHPNPTYEYMPAYPNQPQQQAVLQPPPTQAPPSQTRKKITIRDPQTGIDITSDLLQSGRTVESTPSPTGNTNATPQTSAPAITGKPHDQIAAQFAAQVAAAASQEESPAQSVESGGVVSDQPLKTSTASSQPIETPAAKSPVVEQTSEVPLTDSSKQNTPDIDSTSKEVNGGQANVSETNIDEPLEETSSNEVQVRESDLDPSASQNADVDVKLKPEENIKEDLAKEADKQEVLPEPQPNVDNQNNAKVNGISVGNSHQKPVPVSIEVIPATPPTANKHEGEEQKDSKPVDSSTKLEETMKEKSSDVHDEHVIQDNAITKEAETLKKEVGSGNMDLAQKDAEEEATEVNGKKVYDRKFLMKFRFHDTSMEKPRDLPTIEDIIMDRPLPKSSVSNSLPSLDGMYRDRPSSDFTPKYMSGGGSGHGRTSSRGMRPVQPRAGYAHGGHVGPKPTKKISIQREPELNRTENAWKPSKIDPTMGTEHTTEEEVKTEEILRNVRSILNKLTPQKFQSLMEKLQALDINTEIRLRGVIDLIFEKAIDEPNFCEAYANMCRTMSQLRIPSATSTSSTVEFRKILLTRCQREFEKDRANEEALKGLREKLANSSADEKAAAKEELELAESKERRRMLGNIRFIGELFKLSMLTESIMHNCIMALFRGKDEDSLESLCRLLTTIGKDLDHDKGKQRMSQYFQQIDKIIAEKKTSSRVRFMLQDVMDLRQNDWVPRPIQAQGPKTIEQIHADAKEEKQQQALQAAAAMAAAPKSQSRGGRMGSRGGSGHGGGDEGWTKVQQKPTRYDPNKMKLTKSQFDESNVTLGPSRGKSGWKSGSGSATKSGSGGYSSRDSSDSGSTPRSSTPTTMNRFSALGGAATQMDHTSPYNQRRVPSRHSSREGTKSGSRGAMSSMASARDEKQALIDTTRRLTSQDSKPKPPAVVGVSITEEAMESKCKSIIEEYLDIVDEKEAHECLLELKAPSTFHNIFVRVAMQMSLEKSDVHRKNVSRLMIYLLSRDVLSVDEYFKGVVPVVNDAVDLELDLPKIWECLAQQISPVINDENTGVTLSCLIKLSVFLKEEEKADVFVAEILKQLIQISNAPTVLEMWKRSSLNWKMFSSLDQHLIEEFLERKNLQLFNTNDEVSLPVSKFTSYASNVTKLLDKKRKDMDELFDAIESSFTAQQREETFFVRAVIASVCQKAIVQGDTQVELNKDMIRQHILLLKKYIDTEAKELDAVFALQKLWVELEQPPNILKLLFDTLYDEEIISEQSFFKWEADENPSESEGKGVALLSVNPFFTWLRNAEAESDE